MKRAIVPVIAAVALLFGCGQAPVPAPAPEFEKLWSVGSALEGFSQTDAAREVIRDNGTVELRLTVRPEAFHRDEYWCTETTKLNGRTYKTGKGSRSWQGVASGGTDYLQDVQWRVNGYSYLLSAKTDNPYTRLNIANPETAALLERDPLAEVQDYPLKVDYWWTSQRGANVTMYISLYPEPVSADALLKKLEDNTFEFLTEDGMEYYRRLADGADGRRLLVMMLWRTDKGYLYLHANRVVHVETPDDALDFVNAGFAKSITEQMGGKIIPFGETR